MQLNKFQEKFKETMLDQPRALENLPDELSGFFRHDHIALPERLKIYRNNIVGGIADGLAANFPLIEKLVGKEFLEGTARAYVLANPPTQGCLSTYGAAFDQFIAGFEPAGDLPYLPDVAKLEIALNEAYYARDDEPLTAADLGRVAPEDLNDLHLHLRGSVRLVSSGFPLDKIREFCLKDTPENKEILDIDQGGAELMITRPALEIRIVTLQKDEFEMLEELAKESPLGTAVENVLNSYPDFDFQAFLQRHLEFETFLSLDTNG